MYGNLKINLKIIGIMMNSTKKYQIHILIDHQKILMNLHPQDGQQMMCHKIEETAKT